MSTSNNFTDIAWPANTTPGTLNLGAIPADQSNYANPNLSQVCDLYIVPSGATDPLDFTVPATPTAVANAIDNTATDNSKTKHLSGRGGVPAPEEVIATLPKRITKVVDRTYTLTFNVEVTDESQRDLLRQLMSGWRNFTFYFATLGGFGFGPSGGITPLFVNAALPLGEGEEDFEVGTITIQYRVQTGGAPDRWPNPLASA